MSFDDVCFKNEPNFKFKEITIEHSDCLSSTCQFDCYKNNNGEVILLYPFFNIEETNDVNNHSIFLIRLIDNKEIKQLKGHKDRITTMRYFQNSMNKNEYLISSDKRSNLIVWDLNNFSKKLQIKINYNCLIYSVLLIFDSNKIFAVTSSSLDENDYTKVIDINNQNNIINLKSSNNSPIYFLLYWYNPKKNIHNIIQCGKRLILINEFPNNEIYDTFKSDERYPYNLGGIVFKNKERDLLAVSATYGLIQIYDLQYKEVFIKIILKDAFLYSFVKWNDNYLLLIDRLNNSILILDMKDSFQIKKENKCFEFNKRNSYVKYIKKIEHPLYGESILSVGIDFKIRLLISEIENKNKNK